MRFSASATNSSSQKARHTITAFVAAAVVSIMGVGLLAAEASASPDPTTPIGDYFLREDLESYLIPRAIPTTTTTVPDLSRPRRIPLRPDEIPVVGGEPRDTVSDSEGAADPSPDAAFEDPRATPEGLGYPDSEGAADPSPDAAFEDPRATPEGGIPCGAKCPEGTTVFEDDGPGPCDDLDAQLERPCDEESTTTTVVEPTPTDTIPSAEVNGETAERVPSVTSSESKPAGVLAFTGSNFTLVLVALGVFVAGAAALVAAKLLGNRRTA